MRRGCPAYIYIPKINDFLDFGDGYAAGGLRRSPEILKGCPVRGMRWLQTVLGQREAFRRTFGYAVGMRRGYAAASKTSRTAGVCGLLGFRLLLRLGFCLGLLGVLLLGLRLGLHLGFCFGLLSAPLRRLWVCGGGVRRIYIYIYIASEACFSRIRYMFCLG